MEREENMYEQRSKVCTYPSLVCIHVVYSYSNCSEEDIMQYCCNSLGILYLNHSPSNQIRFPGSFLTTARKRHRRCHGHVAKSNNISSTMSLKKKAKRQAENIRVWKSKSLTDKLALVHSDYDRERLQIVCEYNTLTCPPEDESRRQRQTLVHLNMFIFLCVNVLITQLLLSL